MKISAMIWRSVSYVAAKRSDHLYPFTMQAADLLELCEDLSREMGRLEQLVKGLSELDPSLGSTSEIIEAAALRLHSFYTPVGTDGDGHGHTTRRAQRANATRLAGVPELSPPGAQPLSL